MSRITNSILSPSIPNPQYKIYLNGRLILTLIIPGHPSRCVSCSVKSDPKSTESPTGEVAKYGKIFIRTL